jgi:hypothetical protein
LGDASKEGNVDFTNHSLTPLHLIGKEGREKASSDLDIFSLAQIDAQHFLPPIANAWSAASTRLDGCGRHRNLLQLGLCT